MKVSSTKGGIRFERWGKLSPRYISPFKVLRQIGEVAYEVGLPLSLSFMCLVFHVYMLKKYVSNESHKPEYEEHDVRPDLSYKEKAMQILNISLKTLCKKEVPLTKCSGTAGS